MADCNGCGACCGPVSCTPKEAQKIAKFVERRKITWQEHDDPLTCGFYDVERKRCRIYSVRPWPCRAFGVITEMKCPLFPKAAKQSLPARDAVVLGLMHPGDRLLSMHFADDEGKRQFEAMLDLMFNKGIAERAITEWRAEQMGLAKVDWHEGTLDEEMERVREIVRGRDD